MCVFKLLNLVKKNKGMKNSVEFEFFFFFFGFHFRIVKQKQVPVLIIDFELHIFFCVYTNTFPTLLYYI